MPLIDCCCCHWEVAFDEMIFNDLFTLFNRKTVWNAKRARKCETKSKAKERKEEDEEGEGKSDLRINCLQYEQNVKDANATRKENYRKETMRRCIKILNVAKKVCKHLLLPIVVVVVRIVVVVVVVGTNHLSNIIASFLLL